MMAGDRLKAWPDEFASEYLTLVNSSRRLGNMAQVALDHGIKGKRNVSLLKMLMPMMAGESRMALTACRRMLRAKTARWPNWVLAAVQNGVVLADTLTVAAETADSALKDQLWETMTRSVKTCLKTARKIEALVLEGPMPQSIDPMTIVDEVIRNALELREKTEQRG